jgi:hypothetical protein
MPSESLFPAELWYPLLALVEREGSPGDGGAPPELAGEGSGPAAVAGLARAPSPELRAAILALREALRQELGKASPSRQFWLLLDTGPAASAEPSPLQVSRVLEELRQRFQELRGPEVAAAPDFEGFLREKMRALGFDDLGTAPLLPDLQREALRGLGVGLGSQMAQLLGKMAGWHGESKAGKGKPQEEKTAPPAIKLLRLELSPSLANDKAATTVLRQELLKCRKRLTHKLGWEISGLQLAVSKEMSPPAWRLLLRAEPMATGATLPELVEKLEGLLLAKASQLLTFADFEGLLRQPGCKAAVKELRSLGLEKAALWSVFRRLLAEGGHLRDPLTLLERLLEAALCDQDPGFLTRAALGPGFNTDISP